MSLTDAEIDDIRFSIKAEHHTEHARKFARAIESAVLAKIATTPAASPIPIDARPDLPEAQRQVYDQCRAVTHMAEALASVHRARAYIIAKDPMLQEVIGSSTAYVMEELGDMLNNMDAVDDEADAWMDEIFQRAQERFPQSASTTPEPSPLVAPRLTRDDAKQLLCVRDYLRDGRLDDAAFALECFADHNLTQSNAWAEIEAIANTVRATEGEA